MQDHLSLLPPKKDIETLAVHKKLILAHRSLAELKGVLATIPNQDILISTLSLQEGKESSSIENIVTTNDDIYQSEYETGQFTTLEAKEVHKYAHALRVGFSSVRETGLLTCRSIQQIHTIIESVKTGYRKLPGTVISNHHTGEVVYTPPQSYDVIVELMTNLEKFINNNEFCDLDPLTKMAIIHHQFESIHPFYDGNGRTGRIINILYLIQQGLLDYPILYLSSYINQHRSEYYRLLAKVNREDEWQEWILFMLDAVEKVSLQTINLIQKIQKLMLDYEMRIKKDEPKMYRADLVKSLFFHPYTKIDFVEKGLGVSRVTATKYLNALVSIGLIQKIKTKSGYYFVNTDLLSLFNR
ncbi:MAG: Fic family protein [Candidatus Cloacimonetes bacterium]|nr:Fic family protein [Candidatus Cloacimonadota bacterium]